jgi:hypothetical protein
MVALTAGEYAAVVAALLAAGGARASPRLEQLKRLTRHSKVPATARPATPRGRRARPEWEIGRDEN